MILAIDSVIGLFCRDRSKHDTRTKDGNETAEEGQEAEGREAVVTRRSRRGESNRNSVVGHSSRPKYSRIEIRQSEAL